MTIWLTKIRSRCAIAYIGWLAEVGYIEVADIGMAENRDLPFLAGLYMGCNSLAFRSYCIDFYQARIGNALELQFRRF